MGSNPYRDRLLTVGVISRRTRDRVEEGRSHPESGQPWKAVTDELGNTVTEHGGHGATGVSARQDVQIRPAPVVLKASGG